MWTIHNVHRKWNDRNHWDLNLVYIMVDKRLRNCSVSMSSPLTYSTRVFQQLDSFPYRRCPSLIDLQLLWSFLVFSLSLNLLLSFFDSIPWSCQLQVSHLNLISYTWILRSWFAAFASHSNTEFCFALSIVGLHPYAVNRYIPFFLFIIRHRCHLNNLFNFPSIEANYSARWTRFEWISFGIFNKLFHWRKQ